MHGSFMIDAIELSSDKQMPAGRTASSQTHQKRTSSSVTHRPMRRLLSIVKRIHEADAKLAHPDAGDEPPPRFSVWCTTSIRTCPLRSSLRPRRRWLSFLLRL